MSYLDLFGLVLVLLVLVIVAAVAWAAGAAHGETVGRNQVADAKAVARAAADREPGAAIPLPRDLRPQYYVSPRNEIALTMLSLHYNDQEDAETNVANFFLIADEFIRQADGREGK